MCTEFSKFLFKGHMYDSVGNRGIIYHHQFLILKPMKYWTPAGALTMKWKLLYFFTFQTMNTLRILCSTSTPT